MRSPPQARPAWVSARPTSRDELAQPGVEIGDSAVVVCPLASRMIALRDDLVIRCHRRWARTHVAMVGR